MGGGAAADDLAAAVTARGAVYLASTGFGYGDQVSVGLQERLMTLFAAELDGAVSLGDALRNAKQRYFASQGLYGAYDEKALSSTILYGLPMFAVGTERPVRPTPPNETATPVAGSRPVVDRLQRGLHVRSARRATPVAGSRPTPAPARNCRRSPPAARCNRAPRLDVTAAAGDSSLLPAHGAVVSGLLTDQVVTDFDAAFSRPTLDNAAGEPEPVNAVAAFPTRLAGVTTASDAQGLVGPDGIAQRQQLVLIPGQYLAPPTGDPAGLGTQVLYRQMSGDVYYSASDDWTAPIVGEVVLQRTLGETSADVSVEASDASGHPPRHRALPGRRRLAVTSISGGTEACSSARSRCRPRSPTNRSVSSSKWSTAPATCRGPRTRAPGSHRPRHHRHRRP